MIAVASGKNESRLRELGADELVHYTKTTAEDVVHDVDLVIDSVGSPTAGGSMRTLKRGSAQFPIFLSGSLGTRRSHSRRSERRTGMSWWGGTE